MVKKGFWVLALLFSISMLFAFDSQAAEIDTENTVNTNEEVQNDSDESIQNDSEISPAFVNDFRYRKVNVVKGTRWSSYKRVSDNVSTYNSTGGSIVANRQATFGTTVSGSIFGLNISTAATRSSTVGYTLQAGPNRNVYMGYRVKYKTETGVRQKYDVVTGKVVSSNKYTVEIPDYGQYQLLNY